DGIREFHVTGVQTCALPIFSKEQPEVQWAMNFTAGWIGVFDKKYLKRCIAVGEKTGLYKGKMVSKGCTPEYLPEFIAIESKKKRSEERSEAEQNELCTRRSE